MAAHVSYRISQLIEKYAGSLPMYVPADSVNNWVEALREAAGGVRENANVESN